jgi:monoamine oxidase
MRSFVKRTLTRRGFIVGTGAMGLGGITYSCVGPNGREGLSPRDDLTRRSDTAVLDVLIIGAGFTGISAARELQKLGVTNFKVLEGAKDHVGGRAYSYDSPIPSGGGGTLRFDRGAEYVGDKQEAMKQLIQELGLKNEMVDGVTLRGDLNRVMVIAGTRYVFPLSKSYPGLKGIPPNIGAVNAIAIFGMIAAITLLERSINVLEPWKVGTLRHLDHVTVERWLDDQRWAGPIVKDLVRVAVQALLSVEASEISPYYLFWYTACNDGFMNETNDDTGGPQQYWLTGGTGGLAQAFARPISNDILLGRVVSKIERMNGNLRVYTQDGETYVARKVVVATSPHSAQRISFPPELPKAYRSLMMQPMGRTLKCQVFYKKPFWRANGYAGYVGAVNSRTVWVMDNSPLDGKGPYVLMTFTVGTELDKLGAKPDQATIKRFITESLRFQLDDDRALSTSAEFLEIRSYLWNSDEPNVGGGPNTVLAPGMLSGEVGRVMNQTWNDEVFFASAENARALHPKPRAHGISYERAGLGYMSGAIESGRTIANEVAATLHTAPPRPADSRYTRPDPPTFPTGGPWTPPTSPAVPDSGPILPLPLPKPILPASLVQSILRRIQQEISTPFGNGQTWMRKLVREEFALAGRPLAGEDAELEAVRDFAISVYAFDNGPQTSVSADIKRSFQAIDAQLGRPFP